MYDNLRHIKDKKIFFDIDGTLAEYRFNDHVAGDIEIGGQTKSEIFDQRIFTKSRPLKTVQEASKLLAENNEIFVLGAKEFPEEVSQKHEWLDEYYPWIKKENRIFVNSSTLKTKALEDYSEIKNINPIDIIFVDDLVVTLWAVERAGFKAYHISSFIK